MPANDPSNRRVDPYSSQGRDLAEPQYNLGTENETCGRGAWKYGASTQTADVVAGTKVGFRISYDGYTSILHGGPAQVYLSRPPAGVRLEDYTGHGQDDVWTKIAYLGPANDTAWSTMYHPDVGLVLSHAGCHRLQPFADQI